MCGKCCHYIIDGKIFKCKNLIKLSNGKTLCRIYNNRLGYKIAPGFKCGLRENFKMNFVGCPYNVDGQELSIIGRENEKL